MFCPNRRKSLISASQSPGRNFPLGLLERLSISWRHQLPTFAELGFRALAPDMRGYGRSSIYSRHEDYDEGPRVADQENKHSKQARSRPMASASVQLS